MSHVQTWGPLLLCAYVSEFGVFLCLPFPYFCLLLYSILRNHKIGPMFGSTPLTPLVEGVGVDILNIFELNLAKSNIVRPLMDGLCPSTPKN